MLDQEANSIHLTFCMWMIGLDSTEVDTVTVVQVLWAAMLVVGENIVPSYGTINNSLSVLEVEGDVALQIIAVLTVVLDLRVSMVSLLKLQYHLDRMMTICRNFLSDENSHLSIVPQQIVSIQGIKRVYMHFTNISIMALHQMHPMLRIVLVDKVEV